MEYEQKYEEVLGRVKELLDSAKNHGHIIVRVEDIENAFPEIQESEDERIRKRIIHALHGDVLELSEINEALAWLEKQKNTPDKEYVFRPLAGDTIEKAAEKAVELDGNVVLAFNGAYIPVCNRTKNEIVAEYSNWVKKQGEQNPVEWNEEDEEIRKWLINEIKIKHHNLDEENIEFVDKAIAWLEKQGEQTHAELGQSEMTKTSDKELEPKFHPGDWVIDNFGNTYQIETATEIESEHIFGYTIVGGGYFNDNSNVRLWSINDAKDGDILATWAGAFIYNGNNDGSGCPGSYCGINTLGRFQIGGEKHWTGKKVYPATKEQRDLLFQKMADAGWEWYGDKKELWHKYL